MPDNTSIVGSLDPADPKVADDLVSYSGEDAHVQIVQIGLVSGVEGSRTVTKVDLGALLSSIDGHVDQIEGYSDGLEGLLATLTGQFPASLILNALKTASSEVVISQTIPVGTSVPAAGVDLAGLRNWGILVPTTFDGTQITFQTSDTLGGTYATVRDVANNPVTQTVTAGAFHDVFGELMSVRFLKINTVTVQATTDTVFQILGKS